MNFVRQCESDFQGCCQAKRIGRPRVVRQLETGTGEERLSSLKLRPQRP